MFDEEPIKWFKEVRIEDVPTVGGKGASLGEMTRANFPIPGGFMVTSTAYFKFIREKKIEQKILALVDHLDVEDTEKLDLVAKQVREIILKTPMSEELDVEIQKAYVKMGERKLGLRGLSSSENEYVAVRSSATAEDLPEASFAGQQETFLNVIGKEEVVDAVKRCWASLFTSRAVYYRKKQGFPTKQVGIAVVVQKMVNSDVSGIMFTVHPSGDETKLLIEAGFGLGESVVSGAITPDNYILEKGTAKIVEKSVNQQTWKLVRSGKGNKKVDLTPAQGKKQKLADKFIIDLAKVGKQIEKHYKRPMDIEWALEGNEMYIVQARPITTLAKAKAAKVSDVEGNEIVKGVAASPGVVVGIVRVILSADDKKLAEAGDIIVTKMTSPDWVPVMEKSAGIITDEGGNTCHAAIVSRELGIPCVVGTGDATKILKTGMMVTLDGFHGKIYEGKAKVTAPEEFKEVELVSVEEMEKVDDAIDRKIEKEKKFLGSEEQRKIIEDARAKRLDEATSEIEVIEEPVEMSDEHKKEEEEEIKEVEELQEDVDKAEGVEKKELLIDLLEAVAPKVKVNVALPEAAEKASKTNAAGVGLLRAEHMITASGMHPAEFIRQGKNDELVKAVKDGIKKVASLFRGKPVWYRTFDARSDEFRGLLGGEKEPEEDNPMLGWHGIRRDLDETELLKAQFTAIKELVNEGFDNIGVMLPFVISEKEVRDAKKIAKSVGLDPGKDVKFGVMIETPAACWITDKLVKEGIDFVSFGTNDLTQLTLGIDRNNGRIQKHFSELHPAVLRQIKEVIRRCRYGGVETSICGQAASNPEMVRHLVAYGIDSISANIDAVKKIKQVVLLEQKRLLLEKKR
ncbi:MAG: phosphoenolpyruvate synthase [Candidatus Diapherotrites archaeon]